MKVRTPAETAQAALAAATDKIALSRVNLPRLAVLSMLAGCYIALGGTLSTLAAWGVPGLAADNPVIPRLLAAATFPIGLILIVVLGGELFTGNNALLTVSYAAGRCRAVDVVKNWTLVWLGNFAGALVFTVLMVWLTGLFDTNPWHDAIIKVATGKVSQPFHVILLKGIGANWCVCLAVWLALSGKTLAEKCLGCFIPVAAFIVFGYEHCIANMFFIPAGMMQGADITVLQMLRDNLLPSTIGNILGGALPVGYIASRLHIAR